MLTGALSSLFAVVENYPDLKANQNVLSLQEELTATENKIAFARQFYNDSVLTYNNATQMFPTQHHRRHVQLHGAAVLRRRRRPRPRSPRSTCAERARRARGGRGTWTMYEQIRRNRRASLAAHGRGRARPPASASSSVVAWIGSNEGGLGFVGLFGVAAIVWSLVGYYAGDRMVLAVSGARAVTHDEEPQLWNVVEEMTIAGGLGRRRRLRHRRPGAERLRHRARPAHSSIAVTRGLLEKLNRDELQGVSRTRCRTCATTTSASPRWSASSSA